MQRRPIALQLPCVLLLCSCFVISTTAVSVKNPRSVKEGLATLSGPGLYEQLQNADTGRWAVEWRDLFDSRQWAWESALVNTTASPPGSEELPVTALLTCLNSQRQTKGMTWLAGTLEGRLASLRALAAWTPREPPPKDQLVSLVTSGTVDRLPQVRAQCLSWPGPLSVALFQSVLQQETELNQKNKRMLLEALQLVVKFVEEMRGIPNACKPTVVLTYQVYSEAEALALYPVNALRNLARLQARTPLIAMLDVDLLPSQSMYKRLSDKVQAQQLLQQVTTNKRVYIIPTFELMGDMNTPEMADALVATPGKTTLLKYLANNSAVPFDFWRWASGHNLTDFPRWKQSKQDYQVEYTFRCEPWLLGSRTAMPWHDIRYVGYGENKIQHVMNVYQEGFKFWVLNDVFTVHRPHKHPKAHGLYYKQQKRRLRRSGKRKVLTLKQYTHKLIMRQAGSLETKSTFTPKVGAGLTSCLKKLSWWA